MEIAAFDKKLKKIITVFEAFKADNKISPLERDLLLGYLRDIYELVLNNKEVEIKDEVQPESRTNHLKFKSPEEIKNAFSPEVSQNIDVVSSISASIASAEKIPNTIQSEEKLTIEPKVEKAPSLLVLSPAEQPILSQTPISSTTTTGKSIEQNTEIEVTKVEEKSNVVQPPIEPAKILSKSIATENENLKKIFTINKGSDISEKLAMSPISDIGKSMGLNERMFTITELFSGDSTLFNKTIEDLNRFDNYEAAKTYLIDNLVIQNKWEHDGKLEKAHTFVKLVRRRYPA